LWIEFFHRFLDRIVAATQQQLKRSLTTLLRHRWLQGIDPYQATIMPGERMGPKK